MRFLKSLLCAAGLHRTPDHRNGLTICIWCHATKWVE